jgi:hypothetical protein
LLIPRLSDLRLNSAESCDKFQNQTIKDHCSTALRGDKKLNLGADFKVRVSRRSFHCRDKIEFNLKSLKLEELGLFRAPPLVLRDEHCRDFDLAVNENFDLFSISFRRLPHRVRRLCRPRFLRDAETSKVVHPDKRFLQKSLPAFGRFGIASGVADATDREARKSEASQAIALRNAERFGPSCEIGDHHGRGCPRFGIGVLFGGSGCDCR